MAAIHVTGWREGWLYEKATAAAPTVWTTVDTSQDLTYTASAEVILRVTADSAQYDSTAYTVKVYTDALAYATAQTVTLDVPQGNGNSRTGSL